MAVVVGVVPSRVVVACDIVGVTVEVGLVRSTVVGLYVVWNTFIVV
jgi:hypothetical protein